MVYSGFWGRYATRYCGWGFQFVRYLKSVSYGNATPVGLGVIFGEG
jgi:hypothetical protein